ncbi:unnamed protein product [Penicillium egyptiacum]|uniref:Arb2 domain-containing protein n=1 Tax=Penicillium egyptiacum TaxID=1303716 RepID=A0A9W4K4E4_9EURO|nr:unnamed protein product [Penicillium egyptiacum]
MNAMQEDLLPDDVVFPEELLGLGFVITKDDKIRCAAAPDQGPRYKINRSDRINKVHIETLHSQLTLRFVSIVGYGLDEPSGTNDFIEAIRSTIIDRLLGMGMHFMKIPKGSNQHVPIMVSGNITTAPRVVVFFGEIIEDLGVFSYRDACDDGIPFGSIVGFAKGLLGENARDSPNALVLANVGQNVWYNAGWSPMTAESYHGQHRSSAVDRERPLTARNVIGGGSIGEHVQNIFEQVLLRGGFRIGARIDIIGLSEGGRAAMTYLRNQWSFWAPHISSLSMINPETILNTGINADDLKYAESFAWFMKYRSRGWIICDKPIGTRVPNLNLPYGCNTYSSGEGTKSSCMVTRGVGHILTWMNMMHYSPMAIEKFEVAPGEADPNMEADLASLIHNGIIPIPGGKIEVHSLETMNQIKGCLSGVTVTDEMVTFFKENLYPIEDDDNESDNGSECSVVCTVENDDAFDVLRDTPPDVLPAETSETSDTPDALPKVLPAETPGTNDILPAILPAEPDAPGTTGVLPTASPNLSPDASPNGSPGALRVPDVLPPVSNVSDPLPDVYADALSVPESPIYYDDVIVGRTGPYDLSDLQDIREEEEEE